MYTISLSLLVILLCGAESTYVVGDWIGELEGFLSVGDVFSEALKAFGKWTKAQQGNAMIIIENYSNRTSLLHANYHIEYGDITQITFDVSTGEKQAVSAKGKFLGRTEGMVGWSLPDSEWKVVVYWRVTAKVSLASNKLGLGFVNVNSNSSQWLEGKAALILGQIGTQEFGKDGAVLQCCRGDLCLQGIMTTDNHCNVSIRVLPRKASQLFHYVDGVIRDQKSLNQLLDLQNICLPSSGNTVQAAASIVVLLVIMLAF